MAIITFSREKGSGGIPLAQQLAETLDYTLVNGTKIKEIAATHGLSEDVIRQADEKPPSYIEELDRQTELHVNQIQLIVLEQALNDNVILYGRGGQDLLADVAGILRVRVTAPFEERVESWAEREWIDPDRARWLVRKSDQQRSAFIHYYFDRDWADPLNYDLIINTSRFPLDAAINMIEEATKSSYFKTEMDRCKDHIRDLIIQKKIQIKRLADERIENIWYDIDVKNGLVTLSGQIFSEDGYKAALEAVEGIEGVTDLSDLLQVVNYK